MTRSLIPGQAGCYLDDLEWAKKREIIRALVRRVEVSLEQVQVVFRVDSFPGESDPEEESCNFVGRVVNTLSTSIYSVVTHGPMTVFVPLWGFPL
jgi:hypothetical protein